MNAVQNKNEIFLKRGLANFFTGDTAILGITTKVSQMSYAQISRLFALVIFEGVSLVANAFLISLLLLNSFVLFQINIPLMIAVNIIYIGAILFIWFTKRSLLGFFKNLVGIASTSFVAMQFVINQYLLEYSELFLAIRRNFFFGIMLLVMTPFCTYPVTRYLSFLTTKALTGKIKKPETYRVVHDSIIIGFAAFHVLISVLVIFYYAHDESMFEYRLEQATLLIYFEYILATIGFIQPFFRFSNRIQRT